MSWDAAVDEEIAEMFSRLEGCMDNACDWRAMRLVGSISRAWADERKVHHRSREAARACIRAHYWRNREAILAKKKATYAAKKIA